MSTRLTYRKTPMVESQFFQSLNYSYQGKRMIRGGRAQIRTAMYMAMMSAMQSNPVFRETYQRLLAIGEPKKVAIIACIRKMIVILNSMLRDGVMWETPKV